jgi:molybdopterin-guanine dinucleotide biosynthesis protein A
MSSGRDLLGQTLHILKSTFGHVSVVGSFPDHFELSGVECLADAPGVSGPMAGLIGGARIYPKSPLFVAAVDMPELSIGIIQCLVDACQWGPVDRIVPEGKRGIEPLCGVYFPSSFPILEAVASQGRFGLQHLPLRERIVSGQLLADQGILSDWGLRSLNTPEDLKDYKEYALGDVLASDDTPM